MHGKLLIATIDSNSEVKKVSLGFKTSFYHHFLRDSDWWLWKQYTSLIGFFFKVHLTRFFAQLSYMFWCAFRFSWSTIVTTWSSPFSIFLVNLWVLKGFWTVDCNMWQGTRILAFEILKFHGSLNNNWASGENYCPVTFQHWHNHHNTGEKSIE